MKITNHPRTPQILRTRCLRAVNSLLWTQKLKRKELYKNLFYLPNTYSNYETKIKNMILKLSKKSERN